MRRRSRAISTAMTNRPMHTAGSQVLRPSMNPIRVWTLARSSDWRIVKVALTSGIRSAIAKPASESCFLTVLMSTARFTLTVPLLTSTAPSVSPVSAATSSLCAVRLASIQACSKASDATS